MGKSKEQYMEIMTVQIERERYQDLIDSGCLKSEDVKIKTIEPDEYDYTDSEIWFKAWKESKAAYKKLKHIEFKLRHGKDGD